MNNLPECSKRAILALTVNFGFVIVTLWIGKILTELFLADLAALTFYFGTREIGDRQDMKKVAKKGYLAKKYPLALPPGWVRFILAGTLVLGMIAYGLKYHTVLRDFAALTGYGLTWFFAGGFLKNFKFGGE